MERRKKCMGNRENINASSQEILKPPKIHLVIAHRQYMDPHTLHQGIEISINKIGDFYLRFYFDRKHGGMLVT